MINEKTEEDKSESTEKIIESTGIVDVCKKNDAYLKLLKELGFDDISFQSIIEELGINVEE